MQDGVSNPHYKMITCPVCDLEMKQVTARANPGSLIQLDQCSQCGGIWCDQWELFPIQPEEASRIEPVNQELLRAPQLFRKEKLYCPRCTAQLAVPREPLLGPDLQLQRCPKCDGIWLNRGQLTAYKRYQEKVREEKLGHEGILRRVPEIYSDPKSWVLTGTKGMFAFPQGVEEESSETIQKTAAGTIKIILQALVRMLLGL